MMINDKVSIKGTTTLLICRIPEIPRFSKKYEPNIVINRPAQRQSQILLKYCPCPCQHDAVDCDENDQGKEADAAANPLAEEMAVKVFIRIGFDAPGNHHHFGAQPNKEHRREQNG